MRVALAALLGACWLFAGCVSAGGGVGDALSAWRSGRTGAALERASAEYARFRDGNGLTEAAVRAAAADLRKTLSETPLPPAVAASADRSPHARPGVLAQELRADLLSGEVTATARAIGVVAGLELRARAPELLAIVYRRDPIRAAGRLMAGASVALRSVTVKRLALDALERLQRRP
ncbi:MAG: hypothetical protein CSA66_01465 [Proteobacteria bacterium]|nr:MAG: hypothetical protein CSA66_01465 [Pseudomonadota bacterium]